MVTVVKRGGDKEPLDIEKIHRVVQWACEGLTGVSVSEVELASHIQFYNNIKTTDIHETLIKAAANLITKDTPNYQYVAGRLINYQLRKEVYGRYDPVPLSAHYNTITDLGYYDRELYTLYDSDEWEELGNYIKHERDEYLSYAAMEQFRGKYLVKNRISGKLYETPQMAYMLIAMSLFSDYESNIRLKWVKDLYDALSEFDISFPTPIMAGVRTPSRQYSSCVVIETGDSLDSICATTNSVINYVSQKAGIGINIGRIRAEGSDVGNGNVKHTGIIPFIKLFQAAVKSCSQGGIRGGAATLWYPCWHLEFEELIALKNNKGTEENRVRHVDYGVQFNKVMYERLLSGGNITLFSPHDCPDLYDAFFRDNDEFRTLYEKYEKSKKIRKKTIPAIDLFETFLMERKDTGRIYFQHTDHCNDHGSFDKNQAPIRQSNLCAEICLPASPTSLTDGTDGEISLCILSAANLGKAKKPADLEKPCTLMVRALDALIDKQSYPVKIAEIGTKARRSLGSGIINFAYWLAKNNSNYSNPNLELIHEYAEAYAYYLIRASIDLAKEKGPCKLADQTLYAQGIMPIDTYKKEVDELVAPVYKMDWESLRADAIKYKVRNSTLMAGMPSETSSQISNSTNGFEPPRDYVSIKKSKDGVLPQVVPELQKLENKYELLWDQKNPEGYIKIIAVWQKFFDQSISTNTSYNPKFYPDEKLPMSEMLKHQVMMYKYGIKTGYYFNTADSAGEEDISGTPLTDSEDISCESCTI